MGFSLGEITGLVKAKPTPEPAQGPDSLGICARGHQMFTRETAERLLQRMNARNADDGFRKMNRYRCALCEHWHIGHRR
jgi:hypothetical protein